jgi:branched-chain amino acid transport system substrate-binding protein
MGARSLATVIRNTTGGNVSLVYFGGEYGPAGGAEFLVRALRQVGLRHVAFMGGDGIYDPAFIKSATPAIVNNTTYATNVGFPPSSSLPTVPSATKTFVKEFQRQFPHTPLAGYDYEAFDAANVIIRAAVLAVKQRLVHLGATSAAAIKANRQAIAQKVAATNDYVGSTGQFTFDKNGDTSARVLSVFKVVNGQWKFEGFAPGFGPK